MDENVKKKVGRPAKSQSENNDSDLMKKIKQLEKTIAQLQNNNSLQENDDDFIIRPDKYIKVMSLNFGLLNLSTQPKGQGKLFQFRKFGDVKNIVYGDLANLIHNHQNFAEEGRFYIFNKKVIENHGLVEFYNKFLTKEKIDQILDFDKDQIVDLFKNATSTQQETIVQILIKRVKNGENVDLNKLDIISRIYGQDIYEIANEYKKDE